MHSQEARPWRRRLCLTKSGASMDTPKVCVCCRERRGRGHAMSHSSKGHTTQGRCVHGSGAVSLLGLASGGAPMDPPWVRVCAGGGTP